MPLIIALLISPSLSVPSNLFSSLLTTNVLVPNSLQGSIGDENRLIYEGAKKLKDKIDFIYCIYEVAHIDDNFDYLERHVINQILNILNIDKEQIKIIQKDVRKDLL